MSGTDTNLGQLPAHPQFKMDFFITTTLSRSTTSTLFNNFELSCNTKEDQIRRRSLTAAFSMRLLGTSLEMLACLQNSGWFRLSQGNRQWHFAVKIVKIRENSACTYVRRRRVLLLLLLLLLLLGCHGPLKVGQLGGRHDGAASGRGAQAAEAREETD